MVHSLLEVLPLAALLLLALALALAPSAPDAAGLQLRAQPLPAATVAALCAAVLVFNLAPLLEEFGRCLRAACKPVWRGLSRARCPAPS